MVCSEGLNRPCSNQLSTLGLELHVFFGKHILGERFREVGVADESPSDDPYPIVLIRVLGRLQDSVRSRLACRVLPYVRGKLHNAPRPDWRRSKMQNPVDACHT